MPIIRLREGKQKPAVQRDRRFSFDLVMRRGMLAGDAGLRRHVAKLGGGRGEASRGGRTDFGTARVSERAAKEKAYLNFSLSSISSAARSKMTLNLSKKPSCPRMP